MPIFFNILEDQTKNTIPSGLRSFACITAIGTTSGRIELNGVHFHPAMVSLPQHPIPVNNAPIGTGRSERYSASHPK